VQIKRLEALPAVAPAELVAAEEGIVVADGRRTAARAEVERLQALEYQSREWMKLQARLTEATERWKQARDLLGDAAAIETAVARLHDLRDVLPRIKDIHLQRGQTHQAKQEIERLTKLRVDLQADLAKREHALKQARDKRSSLQMLISNDETRQRTVVGTLRELTARMEKLKECERQESDLLSVRGELARLPGDPLTLVRQARERHETLAALAPLATLLARFRTHCDDLGQAATRERVARKAEQTTLARGKQLGVDAERSRVSLEEAAKALHATTEAAAEARTLLQQARASLKEVTELDGAKVCRHCGQSLTEKHVDEEKILRGRDVRAAEEQEKKAAGILKAARDAERAAREQFEQAEKARNDARVEYSECKATLARAEQDITRLRTECSQVYGELPATYRSRISAAVTADWLTTTYPEADEVVRIRSEADGLPGAREELRKAEQTHESWSGLRAKEAAALANLDRLKQDLPANRDAMRQEHAGLSAEEKTLDKALTAKRKELKDTEHDVDRLARERDTAQAQQVDLDGKLKQQEVMRDHAQQTSVQLSKTLPETWRVEVEKVGLAQVTALEGELRSLESQNIDERGRALARAKVNVELLQRDREALETQRDALPAEARQEPAAVQAKLAAARTHDRACDEALGEARQKLAQLESYCRQRDELAEEVRVTEGDLEADRILAELLGRDRLQLHLVRQAERQVVEHANAVLDRLSGGQLFLKLTGAAEGEGSTGRALELEAFNRHTGEKPINVAFLSGSQKFRVAVSLALGIGQYASKQHRPIESVIIDEGFGCLDHQGRQVMIQELQNLRSQMKCILLVSHQEEFADAFADGYHFRLDGGATQVTRVQK
jgi:DNA repair protein SbcC/Rad50